VIVESFAAKQRDAAADVSAWEREIDALVYALYGLTPEEIQLVEGGAK
jgi:adenine-specific DNA-methyltransferase